MGENGRGIPVTLFPRLSLFVSECERSFTMGAFFATMTKLLPKGSRRMRASLKRRTVKLLDWLIRFLSQVRLELDRPVYPPVDFHRYDRPQANRYSRGPR